MIKRGVVNKLNELIDLDMRVSVNFFSTYWSFYADSEFIICLVLDDRFSGRRSRSPKAYPSELGEGHENLSGCCYESLEGKGSC